MQPSAILGQAPLSRLKRLLELMTPAAANEADREMLRGLAVLGGGFFIFTFVTFLWATQWSWPFPRDGSTLVVGRDFLNFWMYGRAAFTPDPSRFYDLSIYNDALAALLGPGYPGQNVPNPPNALVVMAPFGLLNYVPALLLWFALGLLAFYLGCRSSFADGRALLVVAISPAALMCILSGQSSFLTTAALFASFAFLDRRPAFAGLLIGLLTVKPQLGILLPVMLVASSRWRVIASAAVAAAALFAASVAIGGLQGWVDYVTKALPVMREVLRDPSGIAMPYHATLFMSFRGLLGDQVADAIQAVAAVAAVAAVYAAFRYRKHGDPALLRALLLACTICASPYMGTYDVLPLTAAAIALLADGKLDAIGRRLAQLVFWLPALQLLFGNLQMPGPGLIPAVFALYLLRRLFVSAKAALPAPASISVTG
ncbi:glycosyltransferase family 87 protein [Bradyrhizobium sp. HKCCYLS1011]|uniref:glycosyltransferase family 87 protein n=1 Tax=Bradyrhizobium sp. HKCCYLS1011 TaxID=3420733 RepID=UPI003EC143CB